MVIFCPILIDRLIEWLSRYCLGKMLLFIINEKKIKLNKACFLKYFILITIIHVRYKTKKKVLKMRVREKEEEKKKKKDSTNRCSCFSCVLRFLLLYYMFSHWNLYTTSTFKRDRLFR